MTREFNKPKRYDSRPSSRNTSSNHYGDEPNGHSGKPRLSRDVVDRAWQNGSQRQIAHYQPRGNNGRPQQRQNNYSSSYNSSAQQGSQRQRFDRRPPEGYTPRDQSFNNSNYNNRSQGYRTSQYDSQNDRYQNRYPGDRRSDRTYDRPYNNNTAPRYDNQQRGPRQYSNNQSSQRGSGRYPHDSGQQQYGSGRYSNNQGPQRESRQYSNNQDQSRYERSQPQFQRRYNDNAGNFRDSRSNSFERRPDRSHDRGFSEKRARYEGDYEHLSHDRDRPGRFEKPAQAFHQHVDRHQHPGSHSEPVEKHVTHLPDGRVLKGSRPSQRRQAEFWTEINESTQSLVQPVQSEQTGEEISDQSQLSTPEANVDLKPKQPRIPSGSAKISKASARSANVRERNKKRGAAQKAGSASLSQGPRPSQKGFKWPSQ